MALGVALNMNQNIAKSPMYVIGIEAIVHQRISAQCDCRHGFPNGHQNLLPLISESQAVRMGGLWHCNTNTPYH
eukprot:1778976-Amphidinium_carterae.1